MAHARSIAGQWAERLRSLAVPLLSRPEISDLRSNPAAFTDELGSRRSVDPYLVSAVLGEPGSLAPSAQGLAGDTSLWAALAAGAGLPQAAILPGPGGPLLRHREGESIEVLTESELCALHALSSFARRDNRQDLHRRCLDAVDWHLAELQPDNATNLPWAIHVFVLRDTPESLLDAQTRLHNSLTGRGQPDLRSAFILAHAAMELERVPLGWLTDALDR